MKLFVDNDNKIWAYESDGSQDHLIGDKTAITEQQAELIRNRLKQERFDALSYSEKRRSEYPPLSDYVDAVVKGDQAQIDAYVQACLAVKAKYPKPSDA